MECEPGDPSPRLRMTDADEIDTFHHSLKPREANVTSDIAIRPCEIADIPSILQLWIDADTVTGPTDNAAAIKIRLQRDKQLFLLAVDGERVVGSLMGGWNGWRGDMARAGRTPGLPPARHRTTPHFGGRILFARSGVQPNHKPCVHKRARRTGTLVKRRIRA